MLEQDQAALLSVEVEVNAVSPASFESLKLWSSQSRIFVRMQSRIFYKHRGAEIALSTNHCQYRGN